MPEKFDPIEYNFNGRKEVQNMGENTSKAFSGKAESRAVQDLYNETPKIFSNEIKKRLMPDRQYTIADIGSFKGELLKQICDMLPEYKLKGIAMDINKKILKENNFKLRIASKAEEMPFNDRSIDVEIMRYVLQWNYPKNQKMILKEISRTIKEFALVEHAGADNENSKEWRKKHDKLYNGEEISKLKRGEHYFSSRDEIETWMKDENISFERIGEKRISGAEEVFTERFGLDANNKSKVKEILKDKGFFIKTTWIIFPKK